MPLRLPSSLEMFAQLIAIPSVSSIDPRFDQSNRGVIEQLANWFAELGFEIELMTVSEQRDKLNLIARLGEGDEGLVLAGHTDTVPYDQGAWTTDPFKLTETDGRLYGLGSSDMKCFFPLVIEAICAVGVGAFNQPLIILATADEESTMAGARVLAKSGQRLGRYAVIGEPTGLGPVRMHKGVLMEAIRLHGRSGHASNPRLGHNAIEGMHKVIGALLEWREELQERYRNPAFQVAEPTLNLGNIHGGDSPNRICADCELQIDMRLLPEMSFEELRWALRGRVERAIADSDLKFEIIPLFDEVPALETNKESPIVQVTEQLTGRESSTVAFATEGPFLNALGMETVVLGPGDIDQAHQPDEYVLIERLPPMVELLKKLIGHFCIKNVSGTG